MPNVFTRAAQFIGGIINPTPLMYALWGGQSTSAGESVNSSNAPTVAAVYSCISLIADTIASLPFHLYNESEGGKIRVKNQMDYLVSRKPSDSYNSFDFRRAIINQLLLRGNAYILPIKSRGQISALQLIDTDYVTLDTTSGVLRYRVSAPNGVQLDLLPAQIIHLKAFTMDGVNGLSPILYAKETIGTAMAATKHIGGFYGNGAMPKGILQLQGSIRDADRVREIGKQFDSRYSGSNSGRTAVLTEGAEYKPVAMSMQEAEFIATMRFSVEEICRLFHVPPHKIGHLDGGSYGNSIEAQNAQFVSDCIRPLAESMEMEFTNKLLTGGFEFEMDLKGLMRGDIQAQVQRNVSYWNIGVISANEIRNQEGMPPIEGGDEYNKPAHMSLIGDINNGTTNREEGDPQPTV